MKNADEKLNMIVVMGVTGAGKSYFINKLAGRAFTPEGDDLDPCTQKTQAIPVDIGNSKVLMIDTPGFDDYKRTDAEILEEISKLLALQYGQGVQLKGVIYLHRITDNKYTRGGVKTLNIFQKICGDLAFKNVILVTSRWASVAESDGAKREKQLRDQFWPYMLQRGSTLARFDGTHDNAVTIASILLTKSSIVLDIQHEMVDLGKTLNQTKAGALVDESLEKLKAQHEQDKVELENMRRTLRESDVRARQRVQEDLEKERALVRRIDDDQARLRQDIAAEVRAEIEDERRRKGGTMSNVLPLIPSFLGVLGLFVGIPPGTIEVFSSWFVGLGFGDLFTNFFS